MYRKYSRITIGNYQGPNQSELEDLPNGEEKKP
jgi:hypothetical protein